MFISGYIGHIENSGKGYIDIIGSKIVIHFDYLDSKSEVNKGDKITFKLVHNGTNLTPVMIRKIV